MPVPTSGGGGGGDRGYSLAKPPRFFRRGWGGVFVFVTHLSGGGLENYLGRGGGGGGLNSGVWEGVLFFVSQVVFIGFCGFQLPNYNFKLQVCHAMLCSVVVCCGLLRCKVVWCALL